MRLIDADELIKVLKQRATNENIMGYMTAYDVTNSIIDEVEEQSTVYNIEKVVEELEELKLSYFLTIANTSDTMNDFAYEQVGNALDKTIEIVKQGGVSDDVCEWKYINDFELVSENHESKCIEGYDYKYCPYCGKKIKVGGKNDD